MNTISPRMLFLPSKPTEVPFSLTVPFLGFPLTWTNYIMLLWPVYQPTSPPPPSHVGCLWADGGRIPRKLSTPPTSWTKAQVQSLYDGVNMSHSTWRWKRNKVQNPWSLKLVSNAYNNHRTNTRTSHGFSTIHTYIQMSLLRSLFNNVCTLYIWHTF